MKRAMGACLPLIPLCVLVLAWESSTRLGWVASNLLPAPSAVLVRLAQLLPQAEFLFHVQQTLIRLLGGFAIALVFGVTLGLLASRVAGGVLETVIRVLAPVPKIAFYPAFVLIFGYDHASKIALVVADAIFPILLATFHGARTVEPKLVWSARAAGTGRIATLYRVVLPATLPAILTGCRISLLIACVTVFLAEMISSTDGLGHLLSLAARSFQMVDMFVPLVLISSIGLLLNITLQYTRKHLLRGQS